MKRVLVLLLLAFAAGAQAQNPFLQRDGQRVLGEITFFGNTITREYILRRTLDLRSGDPYSPLAVSDAWTRLEALDFIAYVDIQEKRRDDTTVDLMITIAEDHRFAWSPILRYERSFGGYYGGTDLHFRNLRGRAERIDLAGRVGVLQAAMAHWENPHILDAARLRVFAEGIWLRHDFRYEDFRLRDARASVGLSRRVSRWVEASLRYDLREIEIDDAGAPFVPGKARDDAIEVALEHDSRDIRYYPTKGLHALASARFSGLAQDFDYQLYRAHLAAFANVPYLDVLAGRVSYRFSGQALPIYERSYLGGPGDLRGVDFGAFSGDHAFLASAEIRRPLFLLPLREGRAIGVGLHAFHDWGKAFEHGAGYDSAALHRGWGLGMHLNLNTLNLRFEWARDEEGENRFLFEDSFTF